jgi:hypothetical protein
MLTRSGEKRGHDVAAVTYGDIHFAANGDSSWRQRDLRDRGDDMS